MPDETNNKTPEETPEVEPDPKPEEAAPYDQMVDNQIEEFHERTKGRKFSSDSPSMSEIIRLKKPNTRSCHILLDSALAHELNELEREIEKLERKIEVRNRSGRGGSLADSSIKELDRLREEFEVKEEEAEGFTVEFTFQDIGRKRYDELVKENRPTDEEKKEYKEAGGEGVLAYSTETFPARLVALTSVSPKISEEEAFQIFDEWAEGDLETLFTTALLVCKEPTSLPKSRAGTAKTRASQPNSTTAPNEEFPTLSS